MQESVHSRDDETTSEPELTLHHRLTVSHAPSLLSWEQRFENIQASCDALLRDERIDKDVALMIVVTYNELTKLLLDTKHKSELAALETRLNARAAEEEYARALSDKQTEIDELKTVLQQHQTALSQQRRR